MAILKFAGHMKELAGYDELTATLGESVEDSLRWLNDNGYYGIYDRLIRPIELGKARIFNPQTGHQISAATRVEDTAIIQPWLAGGNSGGSAPWIEINQTTYAASSYLAFAWGPENDDTIYEQHPHEGLTRYWFMYFNGSSWQTEKTWLGDVKLTYPGYIQLAQEGFSSPSFSQIDNLQIINNTTGSFSLPNGFTDYGTLPTDTVNRNVGQVYRSTGKPARTKVNDS